MRDPFDELGAPKLENPQGEEVGGAMTCQEDTCREVVTTGRYLEEVAVLTWKCTQGHISKIENFHI